MIKINDEYSFERGKHCWVLHKHCKKRDPDTKQTYVETYHATLEQMYTKVLSDSVQGCETISDVLEAINQAKQELKQCQTS